MSFRLPQNLTAQLSLTAGAGILDQEILAEKAASLGRAGRLVEQALQELKALPDADPGRARGLWKAAEAVHGYFIQRELCGFVNHDHPIAHYATPAEVLVRLGARQQE